MTVGVLAFQGDVREHLYVLKTLGADTREIRSLEEFDQVDALIIPGGESTVIGKFLVESGLRESIIDRYTREQFPIYGTCAGAILLAKDVHSSGIPDARVASLRLMDITVERNAYGRQTESFEGRVTLDLGNGVEEVRAVFIRAPKIVGVGRGVEILARAGGVPVVCRQGALLVSTFHPELAAGASALHRHFLSMVAERECQRIAL